ncbi:nucleoside-diphosphate kinase [Patescibacteria group bacterium]|nr:nucleoside-diphosphate kinase [Patescibacteria group bacterium]
MKDETVVLIKPDGVRKGIIGEIMARFERVGLKIAAAKMIWVDKTFVGKHYQDKDAYHKTVGTKILENYQKFGLDANESLGTKDPVKIGRMVRNWNMEFLSSGPVFAMLLEGPDAVLIVRKIVGSTFPADALPGTIRGDFSLDSAYISNLQRRTTQNVIHASGSKEEAEFEKKLWFKNSEIYKY